jgi:hypothetical protein
MPLLSQEQYLATFGEPPHRLGPDESPPFDFWPYFESIPPADFEGHDCSAGRIEYAWSMPPGRFVHALVDSEDRNVFMVVVLDSEAGLVYGHRLLDLNREYGLNA